MDCPTCLNDPSQSVVTALVNRKGKCHLESHPCPTCDSKGTIPMLQYERMASGIHFRCDRVEMHMTLSQIAQLAGVTPREVSDYEEGRLANVDHDRVRDAILKIILEVRALRTRMSA